MQSLIVKCKLQSTNHSFSVPERLSGSCRVGCWSDDWIALWGDWHLISQWPNNSPEIRNYYHIPITSVISPDLIFSVLVYQWYSYSYIYIYIIHLAHAPERHAQRALRGLRVAPTDRSMATTALGPRPPWASVTTQSCTAGVSAPWRENPNGSDIYTWLD
jgi:hypothetical protein